MKLPLQQLLPGYKLLITTVDNASSKVSLIVNGILVTAVSYKSQLQILQDKLPCTLQNYYRSVFMHTRLLTLPQPLATSLKCL